MQRDRILVIDGNPLDGAALRAALCEHGFDAVEAATAEGALAMVPSFAPAAVLADTSLPGCDGAALVARLRELGSDAAVVATVPHDRIDGAVAALRAGAESYLVRPLDPAPDRVVLEKALERAPPPARPRRAARAGPRARGGGRRRARARSGSSR